MCVLLRIYRTWPNCDLKASNVAHMGNLSAQKRTNGTQRHQVVAQGGGGGGKCKPKGCQGTKMKAQRGPNGSQWGPHGSPKVPKLEPKSPQERKIEKVKNARSQKVEKLKNPPTLWSGVLEHLETKGGGFLPPTPLRPWRLAGASSKLQPVLAKRSKPRPVWTKRVVEQQKSCNAAAKTLVQVLAPFCVP